MSNTYCDDCWEAAAAGTTICLRAPAGLPDGLCAACSAVFAPHIIRRVPAVERYHRKADRHFMAFLLNPQYGLEASKGTIQVDRKNKDPLFLVSQDAAMTRTVRSPAPQRSRRLLRRLVVASHHRSGC